MPIKKAALKRVRADKKKREKNARIINDLKTRIKRLRNFIANKKKDEALSLLSVIIPLLGKAARKKVIHKNKASRTVSRLKKAVSSLSKA